MVTCKLNMLLAERRVNRKKLSEISGVTLNTLRGLYNDSWRGIRRSTINKICDSLNVGVGDLFEFDKNQREIFNTKGDI